MKRSGFKKTLKPKKCASCTNLFTPRNGMQVVCCPLCAISKLSLDKKKKTSKALKSAREKLKTKSDYTKDAQKAFNRFIRARDCFLPCISCGTTKNVQYAAGHYFTVGGHPELRFNEDNCHKQCNKYCNSELSGNIAAYRVNLLKKIGSDALEKLEGPHEMPNLTIDELKSIKLHYNARALELEKSNKL